MIPFDSDRDNRRPPEDMKGLRCCLHCINCTLKTQNTLYSFGRWWCFYFKKWRRGNDLFEFLCKGFVIRDCESCRKKHYCNPRYIEHEFGVKMNEFTFCKEYENRGVANPNIYILGRHKMPRNKNSKEYKMEIEFRARYGIKHDGDKGYSKKDPYKANKKI